MDELIQSIGRLVVITLVAALPLVVANIASANTVTTLSGEGISRVTSSVSSLLVREMGQELGPSLCNPPVNVSRCGSCQVLAGLETQLR
jgi:hypothetical protein